MTASRAATAMRRARPPHDAAAQPHHRFTSVAQKPARAFATASGDDRAKRSRAGRSYNNSSGSTAAFGALYVGRSSPSYPSSCADHRRRRRPGAHASGRRINGDIVSPSSRRSTSNAFIALELNAWVAMLLIARRAVKARRGGEVPVEAEPAPGQCRRRQRLSRRRTSGLCTAKRKAAAAFVGGGMIICLCSS